MVKRAERRRAFRGAYSVCALRVIKAGLIVGHRHIELDLVLPSNSRVVILGDWITQFTYAVFDGERLFVENYEEGETFNH